MSILVGYSLYLDLKRTVGGFLAMRHVAARAGALRGLQRGGSFIELTLIDQDIDLGKTVGAVESESHAIGYIARLPIGHDHGQVFLQLSEVGVSSRAVFRGEVLVEIGRGGGIAFHPTLIFR